MYHVYVLKSEKTDHLYKGHTQNLAIRLQEHNAGKTRSTRSGVPWRLVHSEVCATRAEAVAREQYFKTLQGGKELRRLLSP